MNLKEYLIGKNIDIAIKYLETKCNGRYIGADESESDDGYEEYFYATNNCIIILGFDSNSHIIKNVRFDTLNNMSKYEPVFESKKNIKISESSLNRIIKESVKKVLKEQIDYYSYANSGEVRGNNFPKTQNNDIRGTKYNAVCNADFGTHSVLQCVRAVCGEDALDKVIERLYEDL